MFYSHYESSQSKKRLYSLGVKLFISVVLIDGIATTYAPVNLILEELWPCQGSFEGARLRTSLTLLVCEARLTTSRSWLRGIIFVKMTVTRTKRHDCLSVHRLLDQLVCVLQSFLDILMGSPSLASSCNPSLSKLTPPFISIFATTIQSGVFHSTACV